MSGPIVRKYGFPNYERIFGERDPQHGVEDSEAQPSEASDAPPAIKQKDASSKPARQASKRKKSD